MNKYEKTLKYLYDSLPVFQRIGGAAYKANLDNTIALDNHLGNPHRAFDAVHIAGTNGKGSVSEMIYEVLRAAGYRTGLYTSPHLSDFRERIIVDGEMIPRECVVDFVEQNSHFIESLKPSFFEVTVAIAFDYFRRQNVDIAVIEVGMGGRLDSTNIITPRLSVITNIDYDHTQFLGDTLAKIATEKAGIIKPAIPVVIGESAPESAPVFILKAKEVHSPLTFADQRYVCADRRGNQFVINSLLDGNVAELTLGMSGDYQRKNICTVLAALDILGEQMAISKDNVIEGLSRACVRGRWQKIGDKPLIICDTGHNKAGIKYVVEQIALQNFDRLIMVVGMVADKDIDVVLAMLPKDAYYIFTRADIPRALDADELQDRAERFNLMGESVAGVEKALERAREIATENDMIFIGGSTFVVAELITSSVK